MDDILDYGCNANYRYVVRGFGRHAHHELYRFPRNPLPVSQQPLGNFELAGKGGIWRRVRNSKFFHEIVIGWVADADEISSDAAEKLIERWEADGWPKRSGKQ